MTAAERKGYIHGVVAGVITWPMLGAIAGLAWGWAAAEDEFRRDSAWGAEQRAARLKYIEVGEKCARKESVQACLQICRAGLDARDADFCTAGVMGEAYK